MMIALRSPNAFHSYYKVHNARSFSMIVIMKNLETYLDQIYHDLVNSLGLPRIEIDIKLAISYEAMKKHLGFELLYRKRVSGCTNEGKW